MGWNWLWGRLDFKEHQHRNLWWSPPSGALWGHYRGSVGDIEKVRFCGFFLVGGIFSLNVNFWMAHKLCIIILLHGELVVFNFHFSKIQKVIIFMIVVFGELSMTPKANYCSLWNCINTIWIISGESYVWKCSNLGNRKFRKDACRQILKIRVASFWKSWILEQYLQEIMNCFFCNFQLNEFEYLNLFILN